MYLYGVSMFNKMSKYLSVFALVTTSLVVADQPSQTLCYYWENARLNQMMVSELESFRSVIKSEYAPYEWKSELFGWDIDCAIDSAIGEVYANPCMDVKNYHQVVAKLLLSMKDYHVSPIFYSTEESSLPFRVVGDQGRYFIAEIDYSRLDPFVYPLHVGDELLEMNGEDVEEIVDRIRATMTANQDNHTDDRLAEILLTYRNGMTGDPIETGSVVIKVDSMYTGISSYQISWEHNKEEIAQVKNPRALPLAGKIDYKTVFRGDMLSPVADSHQGLSSGIGNKESVLPDLGKVIWRNEDSNLFQAYIYRNFDGALVGFLRIPTYMAEIEEIIELVDIINKFEDLTDGLVIDQMSNGGGNLFYAYALASMLTDKPIQAPLHQVKLTPEEIYLATMLKKDLANVKTDEEAISILGGHIAGYPVTYQLVLMLRNWADMMIEDWGNGQILSRPLPLYGIDKINPSPFARYTKPIIMLINELDFSCADIVPAIMQDSGRARLMGQNTAGAGGFVTFKQHSGQLGVAGFSMTGSLMIRADGSKIESVGVRPDVMYYPWEMDFRFNYYGFVNQINDEIYYHIEAEDSWFDEDDFFPW